MSDEQTTPRTYASRERGQRKTLTGVVVSTKMAKTLTIAIARTEMHRKYKKYIRQHSKIYAHDETGKAKVGDVVRVVECRPLSKLKRFALTEVVTSRSAT